MKIVKTTKSRDAETRSPQKSGIGSKAKEDKLSVLYENATRLAIDDVIELIYHPIENSDDYKVTVKHPYPEKKPGQPVVRASVNRKLYSIAIQHGRKHEKERRKSMAWLEPVLSKLNFDVFLCCFFVVRFAQEHDIPIPSFENDKTGEKSGDKSVHDIQCPDLDLVVVCKNIFHLKVDEVKEEFSHVQGKREFISTCYSLLNEDKLDDEEEANEDDEETAELNGISHGSTDSKQEEEEEEKQDTASKLAAALVRQPHKEEKQKKVSPRKGVKVMKKKVQRNVSPKKRKREPRQEVQESECPPIDLAQFASLQFLSAEQDETEKWDLMSLDRDMKALASRLGGPFTLVPRDRTRIRVFLNTLELGWMDMERLMTLYDKVKHTIEATRQLHGVTV